MPAMKRAVYAVLCATLLFGGQVTLADTEKNPATARKNSKGEPVAPAKAEAKAAKATASNEELLGAIEQLKGLLMEQTRELEAQRAALREQRERTEALERQLHQQMAAVNAARPAQELEQRPEDLKVLIGQVEAMADSQKELRDKVNKVQADLGDTKKSVEGRLKSIGPFSFSGDIRMRYEGTFSGNAVAAPSGAAQHRERFRLRLHATAKFNDEFSGGLSLASGDLNNPVSANQTLTTFYIRKPVGIDKAFITYQPKGFKPLSVTAGKFSYTWTRTELMWDNDLNPEGISESLHWNLKNSFLQHLGFVAFQLPLNETFSGGGTVTAPTPSSAMFGGQLQSNWKLHRRVKFGANVAFYHFRNADQIAQNQVGGSGSTTGALGGNNLTNFVGTIGTRRVFLSQFDVLDVIGRFDINTGVSRFPLMLQFDFAQNTNACGNLGVFTSAGVTPPFCDSHQRQAGWAEVQLGHTQEQGDWRFGYTFMRIERDAVPSGFNFDDMRQATNVAQHRFEIFYQAYRNITLGLTGLIGRQLESATSPTTTVPPERFLRRFQFDVVYKF